MFSRNFSFSCFGNFSAVSLSMHRYCSGGGCVFLLVHASARASRRRHSMVAASAAAIKTAVLMSGGADLAVSPPLRLPVANSHDTRVFSGCERVITARGA